MASRAIELAMEINADAGKAAAEFDHAGAAAADMARDVDKATRDCKEASSRMDSVADATDNMASSSSQAAGGMGDLGGALALMPGPLGAVGGAMETVAPAIMGVTGAADLLNLATSSTIVVQAKAKVSALGHAVATGVQSAATKAAAVGQWALNAAMAANPIGLVIIAVLALVAGFILAYKKSETFRNIVQAVGRVAGRALGGVVDVLKDVVGWIRDKVPPAFSVAQTLVVGYVKLITLPIRTVLTVLKNIVTWAGEKVPAGFVTLKDKAVEIGSALTAPFKALLDLIKDVVEWIGKIKTPDLTPWDGIVPGRVVAGGVAGGGSLTVVVQGSLIGTSEEDLAGKLLKLINRGRDDVGLPPL